MITAPTIMGIYLLIMLNVFHVHWDEAYSALRIADYKGFLRLRITAAGDLQVYPIVIEKVPSEDAAELNARVRWTDQNSENILGVILNSD